MPNILTNRLFFTHLNFIIPIQLCVFKLAKGLYPLSPLSASGLSRP
ncbi:hypothetical protein BFAG_02583 [Bacteroides fragilis 3_1_12]|uniref:Uncharacterized protein n=1 Tax=Bacteroides fragilis 3_1_12 TaxID=457424 RepID=A0ABN0BLS3_BACFG|nr:hypothetical protein BFAG_02583 [Bacteroides fragilis 3_1_12]